MLTLHFNFTKMNDETSIFSQNEIEFATVVAQTCLFLEHAEETDKNEFIDKALKLLPLLYLKTLLVDVDTANEEENLEKFVSEEDYLFVKNQIEALLGEDDSYLEVFHPDMPYSDTPIAVFISEDLADIYQELKDFAANFQTGDTEIMTTAIANCVESFANHWGQKLLNALRALHSIRFNFDNGDKFPEDNFHPFENKKLDKDSFLRFESEE